ncbi:MAG TPA: 2-phospho-L-lactate transferase [Pseudonocardiaceae bacterium]|nr:2-phospho-L-lactate transferase [Pseudonocardiaceae bacterium]
MNVVVLAGGVGGARFLLGVKRTLGLEPVGPGGDRDARHRITAVVNTGDDIWLHGLRVCPDLDTCMYTLGGGIDSERGWGRAGETWSVREELAAYGAEPAWFGLGDRDIATHLVRTRMLRAGYPLSAVTEALCTRWRPGVTLLPMTDDRVETHVVIEEAGERRAVHFQEWWVRHQAAPVAHEFVFVGAEESAPAPGVAETVAAADLVLVAPSNPVVSVGSVLSVPGLRDALRATPAPVIGVSPIVGDRPLRGMAAECLAALGVACTAEAVGRHYGGRAGGGLLDGWLVHSTDTADVAGVRVRSVPLLMSGADATAAMVRAAFELAGVHVAA